MLAQAIKKYGSEETDAAPLAVFRLFFGALVFISLVRFYLNGWIEKLYIEPHFFFSYWGFEWVQPLGIYTYFLFIICALAALGVMIGYHYRWSMILLFSTFTYIELMDKTTYLNHYYFISVLSFLMIFLPAGAYFSVDAFRKKRWQPKVPRWTIDAIKLLLGIVYFYAGLAKLNPDWLLEAMPLKIWLPAKSHLPIIGPLMTQEITAYLMSWTGALYDLSIPFLLFFSKTRNWAFAAVVVFHLLTALLFPIGMFPYVMIVCTLIFFDSKLHHRILNRLEKLIGFRRSGLKNFKHNSSQKTIPFPKATALILAAFFAFQFLFPFRFLLYPGHLFWTEQGYRFSWRVMLMEKAGYANFKIIDSENQHFFYVDNQLFLHPFQEKQMATQPDFILEYAHFLGDYYQKQGLEKPAVYVESYVALNGRSSQPFIDPAIDLTTIQASFKHQTWVLPFEKND